MSEKIIESIAKIEDLLLNDANESEKIGLLARGLRWQTAFDDQDLAALVKLAEGVRGKRGNGAWDVERAVYEILCEQASAGHTAFLKTAFHMRGRQGNDRRRLALQGLSRIAAMTGDEAALETLEAALFHHNADTRGWAVGFLVSTFSPPERPMLASIAERLRIMAEEDPSKHVRIEAATALAETGLASTDFVDRIVSEAEAPARPV